MRLPIILAVKSWAVAALSAQILAACANSETAERTQNPPFITCAGEGGCGARHAQPPPPITTYPQR